MNVTFFSGILLYVDLAIALKVNGSPFSQNFHFFVVAFFAVSDKALPIVWTGLPIPCETE